MPKKTSITKAMYRLRKSIASKTGIPSYATTGEEQASSAISSWDRTDRITVNPDDLVSKKGLEIFDEMLTDPQVYAVSEIKKLAILSAGWTIVPAGTKPIDVRVADFVRWSLVRMPGAFTNSLFSILTAMDYGFSITEKILYVIDDDKKYKGLIGIKNLKPKAPHTFDFSMDKFGNILPNGLTQLINDDNVALPIDKFIHFSYNGRFSNPYGKADLRAAYRPWVEKKFISRFWNIYLERFGSPQVYANIPTGASTDEVTKIKTVMATLQAKSAFTLPEGFTVDTLEAKRTGSTSYAEALAAKDNEIARSLLFPDLMGFSGGERSGSLALGKTQADLFLMAIETISKWLETLINEQLIKELVKFNFNVTDTPYFRFDSLKRENRSVRAKLVTLLTSAKIIYPDEPWIREFIELPDIARHSGLTEESINDPVLGERLRRVEEMLKLPPDGAHVKSGDIGEVSRPPNLETLPGRGDVEVQELVV